MHNDDQLFAHLLPTPQEIVPNPFTFHFPEPFLCEFSAPDTTRLEPVICQITDAFTRRFNLVPTTTFRRSSRWSFLTGTPATHLLPSGEPVDHDEGYRLEIHEHHIHADATTADGLRWAGMTLLQLVKPGPHGYQAPGCSIRDWPHFPCRAFMVDQARAPNSAASLKRLIRLCSLYKLNTLVFRESDDELNAVRYPGLPFGEENPYALTWNAIRDLIRIAREAGIRFIPEIESLGHAGARAFHVPHLIEGGIETIYDGLCIHRRKRNWIPGHPETLSYLRRIIAHWLPELGHGQLHLGLDEVRLPESIQAAHLEQVLKLLDELSQADGIPIHPIVWADAPPTPAPWQNRVIRAVWSYAEHNNLGGASANGIHMTRQHYPELAQAGCNIPFLMAGGSGSFHWPYAKNGTDAAIDNLLDWVNLGFDKPNCRGLLAVQWGGNMLDRWLPEFLACADLGWKPVDRVDMTLYLDRLHASLLPGIRLFPAVHEPADHPAWDGIRLKDGDWHEDIVTGQCRTPSHQ